MTSPPGGDWMRGRECPECGSTNTLKVNSRTWGCRTCREMWSEQTLRAERPPRSRRLPAKSRADR